MSRLFTSRCCLFVLIVTYMLYVLSRDGNAGLSTLSVVFPILFLFCINSIRRTLLTDRWMTISVSFIIVGIIFYIVNLGTFSNSNLLKLIYFILPLLIIKDVEFRQKDLVFSIIILALILLIFVSYSSFANLNGNSVGLIVFTGGVITLLLLNPYKKINILLIILVIAIILPVLISSNSRTSLSAFGLFIIGKFMPKVFFKNKILMRTLCVLFTFGSIVYMYTYVSFYLTDFDFSEYIPFKMNEKSAFSGRQFIWMEAAELFFNNPLGNGSQYSLISIETGELHNSVLTLYIYYGLIIATFLLLMINRLLFIITDFLYLRVVKDCFVAYLCILYVNFTEAALVGHYIFYLPLFIAFSEINKQISYNK